jgi:hypothetical protein
MTVDSLENITNNCENETSNFLDFAIASVKLHGGNPCILDSLRCVANHCVANHGESDKNIYSFRTVELLGQLIDAIASDEINNRERMSDIIFNK